jgi:hypothetical protein
MSVSPAHDQIDARSDTIHLKSLSRVREQSTAILFGAAAAVAMVGWLYLLAQGLWAAAVWLIS